jgi:hypothetical protein
MSAPHFSAITPRYWSLLLDPAVRTVFVVGCGGGFDFVHSVTLIPELLRAGKRVIIGSYSFGNPELIHGAAPVFSVEQTPVELQHRADAAVVKRVDGSCVASRAYGPEVGLCQFLDERCPRDDADVESDKKWWCYAYYARAFTPASLRNFYCRVCNEHAVDAILTVDGGSDSLMAGDEAGLGDPLEDAVTLAAIGTLSAHGGDASVEAPRLGTEPVLLRAQDIHKPVRLEKELVARVLVAIGVGCDRFNEVSDGATLRAVAELAARRVDMAAPYHPQGRPPRADGAAGPATCIESGFLGSMALEPTSPLTTAYSDCVEFLQERAAFRSVIANSIVAAAAGGYYGADVVPPALARRVAPGTLFLWPLMAYHFAFAVQAMCERSLLIPELLKCDDVAAMYRALEIVRQRGALRAWEHLPVGRVDC